MLAVGNSTLFGSPPDVAIVWIMVLSGYAAILGTIWSCGRYVTDRLHDFTTECALERERQNEMIQRLMSMRADLDEEDEECDQ